MQTSFRCEYERQIADHHIVLESDQVPVVAALDRLSRELSERSNNNAAGPADSLKGVYIWGRVGRGKSMLMDLFYERASEPLRRRIHFHAFMQKVHSAMRPSADADGDPISNAARSISLEARLLCLDELEVIDIADAMILGRLFDRLFERGVILVATSNDHPDELYRNGPNRDLFIPFVERLKGHVEVVRLGGSYDHRSGLEQRENAYLTPIVKATRQRFDELWLQALKGHHESRVLIAVHGRYLQFLRSGGGSLRVTFEEVCARPLSADDHLAIAAKFGCVFLENVPIVGPEQAEEGRRLVTLVDALYEAHSRLVVLAKAGPDGIFEQTVSDDQRRTVSRLNQMRSRRRD